MMIASRSGIISAVQNLSMIWTVQVLNCVVKEAPNYQKEKGYGNHEMKLEEIKTLTVKRLWRANGIDEDTMRHCMGICGDRENCDSIGIHSHPSRKNTVMSLFKYLLIFLFLFSCAHTQASENLLCTVKNCPLTQIIADSEATYYSVDLYYPNPETNINLQIRTGNGLVSIIINQEVTTEYGKKIIAYLKIGDNEEIRTYIPGVGDGYLTGDIERKMIDLVYQRTIWCLEHKSYPKSNNFSI